MKSRIFLQYVNYLINLLKDIELHFFEKKISIPRHVAYQITATDEQNFLQYVNDLIDLIRGIKLHLFEK